MSAINAVYKYCHFKAGLTTTLETVHTSCGKGQWTVSAMSNHPNLTYRWNTGSFSAFINNLSAGTYAVTVTDVNGC
ncbi:MAG: hypothetical protein IPO94_19895 [Saprospiraceae bacterium]|nr:hypothetical protein [Saprospiraceae bacterium]